MKALEIKIASFCEMFQNKFYFKAAQCELSSWSVLKLLKILKSESFESFEESFAESFEIFDFTVSLT